MTHISGQSAGLDSYLSGTLYPVGKGKKSWLDFTNPVYDRSAKKWLYARDHYSGEAADPDKIEYYLVQKKLGETRENYEERLQLADYTPHFGVVVDELAGMLFVSEEDVTRDWGALGDPDKPESIAGILASDATEQGEGWETLWKLLAIELTGIHRTYMFVDGGAKTTGDHVRVRIVPAESVRNWRVVNGVLVEALIAEWVDVRTDLEQDPQPQMQYLRLKTEGWTRWRKDKDGNPVTVPGDDASGTWTYQTRSGQATIPLVPVELPLKRHVGYMLAKKACAIFNQESARDNLIRYGNFPILNVIGNDKTYKSVIKALTDGARALQNQPGNSQHSFIAPESGPADAAGKILERKVTEFYRVAFKSFEDVARERVTATEIKARLAGGVFAFLTLLKAAVEDAENQVLYLLEQQALGPKRKSEWGQASVERSDDFVPVDINEVVERLRKRYFGDQAVVPVGRTARIQAAMEVARWDGLEADEDEVAAAVDMAAVNESLDQMKELALPASAMAELTVKFLVATGYIKPGDAGEPDTKLADEIRSKAEEVAKAREDALNKAKEQPAGGPPGAGTQPPAGGPPKPEPTTQG